MSLPNSSTLTIDIQTRQLEPRVAGLVVIAAGVSPWLISALQPLAAAALSALCVCIVAAGLHRAGWTRRAGHRLSRVSWLADGRWLLTDESNRTMQCLLVCSDARVVSRGVWLRWRPVGGSLQASPSLLLGPHDLAQTPLRRLIVRLRLAAARHEAAPERRAL